MKGGKTDGLTGAGYSLYRFCLGMFDAILNSGQK
jgi:hypothetical protein